MYKRIASMVVLTAGLSVGTAGPIDKIEKPPGVPPEVDLARVTCPAIDGPCFGYHPTHWRVLPPCHALPIPLPARPELLPPTRIPPSKDERNKVKTGTKLAPASPEKPRIGFSESPFGPVQTHVAEPVPIRLIRHE